MTEHDNNTMGTWTCKCGRVNEGKFCVICGSPRPAAPVTPPPQPAEWVCACGEHNKGKFCVKCGKPRPAKEAASVASAEADGNNGMMKKVAIGVAVLLVLLGAYFMFGRKKEEPPAPEPAKVETKAETKAETKSEAEKPADLSAQAEKPMDPAAKAAKLKEYAEMMKAANDQKKRDATANEKIVFLVENVQRKGNDLSITGHFYNGKKNRTIIGVKAMELDIVLRDMDKELLNEKNIKYAKAFSGMNIAPLQDSPKLSVDLPGKAPAAGFNNYVVSVHDVHWEAVGK